MCTVLALVPVLSSSKLCTRMYSNSESICLMRVSRPETDIFVDFCLKYEVHEMRPVIHYYHWTHFLLPLFLLCFGFYGFCRIPFLLLNLASTLFLLYCFVLVECPYPCFYFLALPTFLTLAYPFPCSLPFHSLFPFLPPSFFPLLLFLSPYFLSPTPFPFFPSFLFLIPQTPPFPFALFSLPSSFPCSPPFTSSSRFPSRPFLRKSDVDVHSFSSASDSEERDKNCTPTTGPIHQAGCCLPMGNSWSWPLSNGYCWTWIFNWNSWSLVTQGNTR